VTRAIAALVLPTEAWLHPGRIVAPHDLLASWPAEPVNGFLEVETEFGGETLRGFAAAQFLKRV